MKKIFHKGIYAVLLALAFTAVASCGDDEGGGKPSSNIYKGHEYVDLGLSVKWATCNVGADQPYAYGDYFAWGETQTKASYSWSTYKYGTSYDNLTKYCTDSYYGTVDNKATLDADDDAATANWGGKWRMPTKAEQDELRLQCEWTWQAADNTDYNGIAGYKVTSKTNGNSIFLPAAGYVGGSSLYDAGSGGYYWSASLRESGPGSAYGVYFGSGAWIGTTYGRYDGFPVRAVLPE